MTRRYIQEAARLAEKTSDGSYRVILITEGTGSTGVYSADLMNASEHVFENAPSYMDHPIDPERPQDRPVLSIGGRFANVTAEDGPFGRQLAADFKPREEYRSLFEEFGDILGLSIFCGAYGEKDETGRVVVESFDAEDPYRSVDVVVAAGRGGRFKRAQESLRAIESSLGAPKGNKPAAEASAEEKEGETMDEKEMKALAVIVAAAVAESLKPVIDFVNESAASEANETQTKVDAEALDNARAEGATAAAESFKLIDDAKLPEKIAEGLRAKVLEGKDITEAVTDAKAVLEAAQEADGDKPAGFVINESANDSNKKKGWTF